MIVSHINNSDKYFCLHRHLKEAFAFLRTLDKSTKPQSFSFDGFSGSIVAVKTDKKQEESDLEAHREYLDIHYVLCGEEGFGYADVSSLTPTTDYNSEKDYILLKGGMDKLLLKEGEFCIVFPERETAAFRGIPQDSLPFPILLKKRKSTACLLLFPLL